VSEAPDAVSDSTNFEISVGTFSLSSTCARNQWNHVEDGEFMCTVQPFAVLNGNNTKP
jgi:hypothetical protein